MDGPPELRAALENAPADPLGNRWAQAYRSGRRYLAVLREDGHLVVESKWTEHGHRYATRLTGPPEGLAWRPLKLEGSWPGV